AVVVVHVLPKCLRQVTPDVLNDVCELFRLTVPKWLTAAGHDSILPWRGTLGAGRLRGGRLALRRIVARLPSPAGLLFHLPALLLAPLPPRLPALRLLLRAGLRLGATLGLRLLTTLRLLV